jgi:hypothetical protein
MTFKRKTQTLIAEHEQRLAEITADIERVGEARVAKLLADADAGQKPDVAEIEAAIAALQADARHERETIAALEARAAQEKVANQAKQRAGIIDREEAGFADLLKGVAEYQSQLDAAVKSYRQLNEKLTALVAGYPFSNSDRLAIGLAGIELKRLSMHYLYKIGATINQLGGLPVDRLVPSFPGGQCPKLEWAMMPEKIQTLVEAYQERADYASKVMRGAAGTIAITPAVSPDAPTTAPKLSVAANPTSGAPSTNQRSLKRYIRSRRPEVPKTSSRVGCTIA